MTNKFQTFFEAPYEEIKKVLATSIRPNFKILDIGCNNGNLEAYIDCIAPGSSVFALDVDNKSILGLKKRKFEKIHVEPINEDVNHFLINVNLSGLDAILINATLHEINSPVNQRSYLDWMFSKFRNLLRDGGLVIIGDYYYHPSVSDDEVRQYMDYQIKAINHADNREKFIFPELLKERAISNGFAVDYFNQMRAVKEVDRRYYTFILRKNSRIIM